MQADVILKEPPPWMPPLSLSGGARVEGGAAPPPRTPLDFFIGISFRNTNIDLIRN